MSHTYTGGICRCLGVNTPHNELEQVTVFSREGQLLDYYKDIDEYFQYNPHKRDRAATPKRPELAFDPIEAREDFRAKQLARMMSKK